MTDRRTLRIRLGRRPHEGEVLLDGKPLHVRGVEIRSMCGEGATEVKLHLGPGGFDIDIEAALDVSVPREVEPETRELDLETRAEALGFREVSGTLDFRNLVERGAEDQP